MNLSIHAILVFSNENEYHQKYCKEHIASFIALSFNEYCSWGISSLANDLLICKHTNGNASWEFCDFGLVEIAETETNQEGLCSLWYCPPEVLLVGEMYKFKKTSIDIYVCALLIAETV
mmetsp:Transcript_27597/g.42453  ORF Transcript_27597/g.42453 Transcript_27597/m.42453 type:complete len:119 (+) Transcript_27597:2-358(+)